MGVRVSRLCLLPTVRRPSSHRTLSSARPSLSTSSKVSVTEVKVEGHTNFNTTAVTSLVKPCTLVPRRLCNTNSHYTNVMACHVKARCTLYPRMDVPRFPVPDDKVAWDVEWSEYSPVELTAESLKKQPPWADHPDPRKCQYNKIDDKVDRRSLEQKYNIDDHGAPMNPKGRTGVRGRGCLGHWGPNHAADPVVTRWKRKADGEIELGCSDKSILQFIAVQRRDNKEWALPGGMVDPGETQTVTLKREFGEEALNSLLLTDDDKEEMKQTMNEFFNVGEMIYQGYVDDPRNTDSAWMETQAYLYHDENGSSVAKFKLNAGDDAMGVQWMDIDENLKLYANHRYFIRKAVDKVGAHW